MTSDGKHNEWSFYLARLALLLFGFACLLVCVPGKLVPPDLMEVPDSYGPWHSMEIMEFEHGWPMPYLRRAFMHDLNKPSSYTDAQIKVGERKFAVGGKVGERKIGITWSRLAAWSLSADVQQWQWGALAVDIMVVCTVLLTLRHYWKQCHKASLKNFGLIHIFIGVACLAISLGWYIHHWKEHHRELEILSSVPVSTYDLYWRYTDYRQETYNGPDWLVRLLGSPKLIPICHRACQLQIDVDEMSDKDWKEITSLNFVRKIGGNGFSPLPVDDRVLVLVSRWTRIESLTIVPSVVNSNGDGVGITDVGFDRLSRIPKLNSVTIMSATLSPRTLNAIGKISSLRSLHFTNCQLSEADDLFDTEEAIRNFKKQYPHVDSVVWF